MKAVTIQRKTIGVGNPVYIIAEIGINHNGDTELARETIAAALEAGVDAVKLQTYKTEGFVHPKNSIFDAVKSCELSYYDYQKLFLYTQELNGTVFSTPECIGDIDFLSELGVPAIKIASMDLNYQNFIQHAASLGKPVLLSTGMAYLHEVANAVRWIQETGNELILLLHCVSCYPTLPEDCNLRAVQTLATAFGYPTGFSDHSLGVAIPYAAACMGANILEKHFTLDKKLPGPDHSGSADPDEMKTLVTWIRQFETARGDGYKQPAESEITPRASKRRGLYASRSITAGDILSTDDIELLTPSLPRNQLENLNDFLGRSVKTGISEGDPITSSQLQ